MSGLPPKKNTAYSFEVSLVSQADTDIFKTTVTLAAGDVLVSKDGSTFSNIGTLPDEIEATGVLTVALTADEMNADRVAILFHDAAGSEWQDQLVTIETDTAYINEVPTNTLAIAIETGYDVKEVLQVMAAALAGKASGGGTTTITFRDIADSANRIVATVDSSGNRSAVTLTTAS